MSQVIERLRQYKEDRGMMANLRCILVETKKHRAWPVLNRLGLAINDEVPAYVAGLYATHPEETDKGNLGATCLILDRERHEKPNKDKKLTTVERRFQHLLAAEKGPELCQRVLRMVLRAKAEGVRINFGQLERDLYFWGDRTKTEWAASFWIPGVSTETEEGA
ncbi:MAG: type I-E CRISPR-associated protein Cse2/CasB [Desulfobacterium sp.]|nr:type I-E CRISPR-associated protein Cse2/CasB [Desulfobacteraceae bacterium]MBA3036158.1 type I-E CRISPR-associated protein Cse2/CasB [Desulfobacterium sp.]MBU4053671.1 type I-E CRISPR-associated protein Cse2/CasB [Pseudomonadota bacterium]